jgi:mannose-6-phosphate isomerase-like protein (cupin superfamily)
VSDYTAKRIAEMQTGYGGGFVKVRAELGLTAFGVQIIRLPPGFEGYPEHDHSDTGQEELFVRLSGSGWIDVEGERVELDDQTLVRVGPGARRKVYAGPEGLEMLAVGGTPGEAYRVNPATELETA